jgi:hypothetical protein
MNKLILTAETQPQRFADITMTAGTLKVDCARMTFQPGEQPVLDSIRTVSQSGHPRRTHYRGRILPGQNS